MLTSAYDAHKNNNDKRVIGIAQLAVLKIGVL